MSLHCVYKHTFPDGSVYIGQTRSGHTEERWQRGRGYQGQKKVFSAIVKYGWDNILHEVIEDGIPDDKIDERERYFIKAYNATKDGYNSSPGGKAPRIHEECPTLMHILNILGYANLMDYFDRALKMEDPDPTDGDYEIFNRTVEIIDKKAFRPIIGRSINDWYGECRIDCVMMLNMARVMFSFATDIRISPEALSETLKLLVKYSLGFYSKLHPWCEDAHKEADKIHEAQRFLDDIVWKNIKVR